MNHVRKPKLMYPDQWAKKYGVWDEKTQSYIKPSGTVKQGRRPMFKPFDSGWEIVGANFPLSELERLEDEGRAE